MVVLKVDTRAAMKAVTVVGKMVECSAYLLVEQTVDWLVAERVGWWDK